MQMLFTFPVVCVAIIILTFVLRGWRILLAIPATIYGPPGIDPREMRCCHQIAILEDCVGNGLEVQCQ
jgi:hypothetical protein